ncbi:hypothetical protein GGR50DRAFT_692377 [Xylaria sp. CBS 124048]|nr:hypothetical protein GGR50DRAFT_692377 [Xylaria sp. CBS 124048]
MSDAVIPRSFSQSESVLLKLPKRDNETLQNINIHFLDVYQRFKILAAQVSDNSQGLYSPTNQGHKIVRYDADNEAGWPCYRCLDQSPGVRAQSEAEVSKRSQYQACYHKPRQSEERERLMECCSSHGKPAVPDKVEMASPASIDD